MKFIFSAQRILSAVPVALCFTFVALTAGPLPAATAPAKEIPLTEVATMAVTEGSPFYPANRDVVNPSKKNPDKAVGTWNWETAEKYDVTAFPSEASPWKDKGEIEKLISSMPALLDCDPKTMKAHPAAADFPGVPKGDVELVERTVEIDPSITGWHSLGLWAPPGAQIQVEMLSKTKYPVTLRIGSQTDFLAMNFLETHHEGVLKRMPRLTNSVQIGGEELKKRKFTVANPFGGLIYIDIGRLNSKKSKLVHVKISGAAPSPLYIYEPGNKERQTTKEDWAEQMKKYNAPWGEIRTPRLIFTLPTAFLKDIKKKNMNAICKQLQTGMAMEDWIVAWDLVPEKISQPMRFVVDRQIILGWGHSGYPAMGYMPWGNCIRDSSIIKAGSWGLWHELGHNHQMQTPYFWIDGYDITEVTVNVFSTIAQVYGCDVPYEAAWEGGGIDEKTMAPGVLEFLDSSEKYANSSNATAKLYFYIELMRELGYDTFRAVGVKYQTKPKLDGSTSPQERWDWFLTELSAAADKNLGPYFKAWKIDVSDHALAKAAKHPEWDYLKDYPEQIRKALKKKKTKKHSKKKK